MISENVGNIEQVQALINELNFDELFFRRKCWYAGKEFIKRKGHNHFKFKTNDCGSDLSDFEMFRRRTEHHNPWLLM